MNSKCILDFENYIFKYVVVGYREDYYYRSSNIQYLFVGADMREQILRKLNIGLQNKVSFAYYNHWIWNNMKKLLNFDKDIFYLFYEIY